MEKAFEDGGTTQCQGKGKGKGKGKGRGNGKGPTVAPKKYDPKRSKAERDAKDNGISFNQDTTTDQLNALVAAEKKRIVAFLTEENAREAHAKVTPAPWRSTVPGATWGRVDPTTYPIDYSRQDRCDDSEDGWVNAIHR